MKKSKTKTKTNSPSQEVPQKNIPGPIESNRNKNVLTNYSRDQSSKGIFILRIINNLKNFMNRPDASQWCIFSLTIFLAIFAGISAYFTCRQISIYKKTTEFDLRAYIVIRDINIILPKVGSANFGWVELENIGKTPAYINRQRICMYFDSTTITTEKIENFMSLRSHNGSKFVLGFNNPIKHQFPVTSPVTKEEFSFILRGKMKIFGFGEIIYKDIFNKEHFTHFCGVWDPETTKTIVLKIYNDAN